MGFRFDQNLRDVPVDLAGWMQSIEELKKQPETIDTLAIIGVKLRTAEKLDEAEVYLKKALSLSHEQKIVKKIFQNLIRLAHVYQWKKDFTQAKALFTEAHSLMNTNEIHPQLIASYHQHFGKFYFDQNCYLLALCEFELAKKIRVNENSPQDQLDSTQFAIDVTKNKIPNWKSEIIIRRAMISDAEKIHDAHMRSINQICIHDHGPEEIAHWGGRSYDPSIRLPAIRDDFYLTVELNQKIEGFLQARVKESQAHLFGLYLTPKVLKQGVGDQLMQIFFEMCKWQKIETVTLKSSLTALGFYKKWGFIEEGPLVTQSRDGRPLRGQRMKMSLG